MDVEQKKQNYQVRNIFKLHLISLRYMKNTFSVPPLTVFLVRSQTRLISWTASALHYIWAGGVNVQKREVPLIESGLGTSLRVGTGRVEEGDGGRGLLEKLPYGDAAGRSMPVLLGVRERVN